MVCLILFGLIVFGVFKLCLDILTGIQDTAKIAKDERKKRGLE